MGNLYNGDIKILDLGIKPFDEVWSLQKILQLKRIKDQISDTLILVEHEPVYTFGKNVNRDHLLPDINKKIRVFNTERGGDITFHGPGQLVVYPIINLKNYRTSIFWYIRTLEEVIIECLKCYEIFATRIDGLTGVWVKNKKIAALGVKISRWVTMHGFSLNIYTDLKYYDGIIPCGIKDYGVTSIEKLSGKVHEMSLVKRLVRKKFDQWDSFFAQGFLPNPSGLEFFFRAITPPGQVRRYDTRFFLTEAKYLTGELQGNGELIDLRWINITQATSLPLSPITTLVLQVLQECQNGNSTHPSTLLKEIAGAALKTE